MDADPARFFFSCFEPLISSSTNPFDTDSHGPTLPTFRSSEIVALLNRMQGVLKSQPIILETTSPLQVVGDIHGNLRDLVLILRTFSVDSSYLFLGDYVDRGEHSLECVLLLFALACRSPTRFLLLRGNHELTSVASTYGFRCDILSRYDEEVFLLFMEVFAWLPLAAIVNDSIFCVHGGIGPGLHTLADIHSLERPIRDESHLPIVRMLLWADPTTEAQMYLESDRGSGIRFGAMALRAFLRPNGLSFLVRGHQCVDGVKVMSGMSVATVFSSSQYEGMNRCGVLVVNEAGEMAANIFTRGGIVREPPFFRLNATAGTRLGLPRVGSLSQIPSADVLPQGLTKGMSNYAGDFARIAGIGCFPRVSRRTASKKLRATLPSFMDPVDIDREG